MSGTAAFLNNLANPPGADPSLPARQIQNYTAAQDLWARQATAQAYSQAVDPTTGQFDPNRFNALVSRGPAAWNAGPAMQQAGTAMGAQTSAQNEQFAGHRARLNYMSGLMAPLLGKDGPITAQDVVGAVNQAARSGNLTPQEVQQVVQDFGTYNAPSGDYRDWVAAHNSANMEAQSRLTAYTPIPQVVTDETGTHVIDTNVRTNPGFATSRYRYLLQPGAAGDQVDVTMPDGTVQRMTSAMWAEAAQRSPALQQLNPGGPRPVPGGAVTNESFQTPGNIAPPGRFPQRAPPQPGGDGTTPAPPGAAPGGPAPAPPAEPAVPSWRQPPPPLLPGTPGAAPAYGTGPTPGYVESQRATAGASTQAFNTLQEQAANTRNTEPLLADMERQLRTGGFTPGIGSTTASTMRQLWLRFTGQTEPPDGGVNLASPEAAQEEFKKDAALLQAAQLNVLGRPTDARQELAETTNPGLMLTKYGNLGIIHMLQGNQQAIRAMSDAWGQAAQNGWTPDRYNEWMNQHFLTADRATGGRFDPRAFWFANTPTLAEQRDYFRKIPQGQRQQFLANLQYAKNMGWINQQPDGSAVVASQ